MRDVGLTFNSSHSSCDPRIDAGSKYWAAWNAFEIETGSEDTFREMLRIKRAVQASVSYTSSYHSRTRIDLLNSSTLQQATSRLGPQLHDLVQQMAKQKESLTRRREHLPTLWRRWKPMQAVISLRCRLFRKE